MNKLKCIAAFAVVGLAACTPAQRAAVEVATHRSSTVDAGYAWDVQCDSLAISQHGYPPGTEIYVTADGEAPLHLGDADPSIPQTATYTFPVHVTAFGIYIRGVDGVVVADTSERNACG